MEAELVALAASGASTLITLMVSDAWAQTKTRLAAVLGRTGDERETLRELEASRAVLVSALAEADDATVAAVEGEWRARLSQLLLADSSCVEDLHFLAPVPGYAVHNNITGRVQAGLLIQAGRIERSTFHTLPEQTA
ncbi:hypothetical protein [Nonomuraea sp. NPDC001831]|uniref:hypothetical protein n=1 Tax=Nonomuraea sp. NPDC001831 TaxID=3364340 RepID=UPI00369DDC31